MKTLYAFLGIEHENYPNTILTFTPVIMSAVYTSYYECHLIKTLLRYSTDRRNGDGEAARRTIRLPPSTCRKSASLQGRVCQHGPPM